MFDWMNVSNICDRMAEEWDLSYLVPLGNDDYVMSQYSSRGLCDSLALLPASNEKEYVHRVINSLPYHAPYSLYKWPLTRDGAVARVSFCQQLSQKARVFVGTDVAKGWRLLLEAWSGPTSIDVYGDVRNAVGDTGLCLGISALSWDLKITLLEREVMRDELFMLPNFVSGEYYWPKDEYGAKCRRGFCEKMVKAYGERVNDNGK